MAPSRLEWLVAGGAGDEVMADRWRTQESQEAGGREWRSRVIGKYGREEAGGAEEAGGWWLVCRRIMPGEEGEMVRGGAYMEREERKTCTSSRLFQDRPLFIHHHYTTTLHY
jgi:hypothetical protein